MKYAKAIPVYKSKDKKSLSNSAHLIITKPIKNPWKGNA